MATLNVPSAYATILSAVSAARPGDTITVASGYGGDETVSVSVDKLTFDAPSDVTGIVLEGGFDVSTIALRGGSSITVYGGTEHDNITGNAGDNVLDGSTGQDTINGGGGNDTIVARDTSGDRLFGDAGNDTFKLSLFSTDRFGGSIDGGAGIDTVSGDLGGYTFENVEVLDIASLAGPSVSGTIAQLSSFSSIINSQVTGEVFEIGLRGVGGAIDFSNRVGQGERLKVFSGPLTSGITLTASLGDDYLTGTDFNDTIDGGDGNDRFDLDSSGSSATGKDVLKGGNGDDLFDLGEGGAGSIDGGADTDTVKATKLGSFTFRNVEVLDADVVQGSIDQISSFATFKNGQRGGEIVINLVGDGGAIDFSDRVVPASGVSIFAQKATSGVTITGSIGNDHLSASSYSDILDGGAGNDRFDVSDPAVDTSGGIDTFRGAAGNDSFNLYYVGQGSVDGGSGSDTVNSYDLEGYTFQNIEVLNTTGIYGSITQLNSFDRIVADDVKSAFQIDVTLRGKGGRIDFSDLLTGADSVRLSADGLRSGLKAKGTKYADSLHGSRFSDTLDGGAGNDTFYGYDQSTKADILKGGSGNDVFDFRFGFRGSIDGGSGIDTVKVLDLEGLTFRSIEKVDTSSLRGTAAQISSLDHITDSSAAQTSIDIRLQGKGGTLDFSHRLDGRDSVYIWGTEAKAGFKAMGTANRDVMFGSKYADVLTGGRGDDSLQGENGNDVLVGGAGKDFLYGGGLGADKMTGGAGADIFAFAKPGDEPGVVDHVTDFAGTAASGHDQLRLTQFSLPRQSGHLADDAFKDLGVAGATVDADDRIVYDHRTGALSYDPDGSGAKAAVQFALLDNHALLTAHDFIV